MNNEIAMSSVTYAMKGKEILAKYGIKSAIKRQLNIDEREGCGYRLIIKDGKTDKARQILEKNKIKIREG